MTSTQLMLAKETLPFQGTAGMIARSEEARFGANRPPAAIVFTHGHIDQVGALSTLASGALERIDLRPSTSSLSELVWGCLVGKVESTSVATSDA